MAKQQTIFIVEDEATIREVVRKYLELDGFAVVEAETGPQALALLAERQVDLILLDIMLPGLDGFTITRSIRDDAGSGQLRVDGSIPIIMLTSRSAETDRLAGFALGVDDYIVKPFSPRELVARVKAVLRRSASASQAITERPVVFADLQIDPGRHLVTIGERAINLTVKEFD